MLLVNENVYRKLVGNMLDFTVLVSASVGHIMSGLAKLMYSSGHETCPQAVYASVPLDNPSALRIWCGNRGAPDTQGELCVS